LEYTKTYQKMQGLWRGFGLGLGKVKFVEDDGGGLGQKQVRSWNMGKETYERKMVHHQGIKQLWESKWKFPVSCSRGGVLKIERADGVGSAQFQYIPSMMESLRILSQYSWI
jgi:hypothetical protein